MKKTGILLIAFLILLLVGCGITGPTGEKGDTGDSLQIEKVEGIFGSPDRFVFDHGWEWDIYSSKIPTTSDAIVAVYGFSDSTDTEWYGQFLWNIDYPNQTITFFYV